MNTTIKNLKNVLSRKSLLVAAAGAMMLPAIASASDRDRYDRGDRYDYRDDHRDYRRDDRRDDHRDKIDLNIRIGSGPVYENRVERVWVEPVYRTVCDRIWRPAVTQDVCDRVWVEACYEDRDTVYWEHGRKVIRRERVLVSPGHYEDRHRTIVISEGHWENVERQELVSAGHFEDRTTRVRVDDRSSWSFGIFGGLPR